MYKHVYRDFTKDKKEYQDTMLRKETVTDLEKCSTTT